MRKFIDILGIILIFSFSIMILIKSYQPYRKENAMEILRSEFPKAVKIAWVTSDGPVGHDWYIVIDSSYNAWKIGFVQNGRDMIPLN